VIENWKAIIRRQLENLKRKIEETKKVRWRDRNGIQFLR